MFFRKATNIAPSLNKQEIAEYKNISLTKGFICNAPFSALYFHPDGQITACCLNKNHFYYGYYPEKNISDIIDSIPRKLHQKYLSSANLELGCKTCLNNIKSGNFAGVMAKIYNGYNPQKIERLDFELSHLCNLDCIMCQRDKNFHSNTVYKDNFFNQIKNLLRKIKFANFVGGEPFLIKQYYDIWNFILENNPHCIIYVQTNVTILNDEIKNLLKYKNFITGLSIDSINKNTYSQIRRNAIFEDVMKNYIYFKENSLNKDYEFQVSVCPLRINRYEIPEIMEFFDTNSTTVFFNTVEYPENLSLLNLPSEELKKLYDFYKNKFDETSLNNKKNKQVADGFLLQINSWLKAAKEREKKSTIIYKSSLAMLFKNICGIRNQYIAEKILKFCPEKWFISNEKYNQIQEFDFNNKINELINSGLSDDNIIILAKDFLELTRYENI